MTRVAYGESTAMGAYLESGPAPAGGAVFALAIKSGEAAVITFPATVTLLEGETGRQFPVTWAAAGTTILQIQLTELGGAPVTGTVFERSVECLAASVLTLLGFEKTVTVDPDEFAETVRVGDMTATCDLTGKSFTEGDDLRGAWTLQDDDGDPYDFTGVTKLWITVKKSREDDDDQALIGPLNSVDDPTQVKFDYPTADQGLVWVWFKAAETAGLAAYGTVFYDVQVLKNGLINTVVDGDISFKDETTRAQT